MSALLAGLRSPLAERLVRPYAPAEVTTRAADREVDPREVGLSFSDIDAVWAACERLYESGLHPAVALCLRRRGRIVVDRALGHVSGNAPDDPPGAPKVRATPDTLFNLFSASKAVTAMAIHLLDERRLVHLDDAVDEYIPGFGCHGKEWITIRHVLTHRAGIPTIPGDDVDLNLLADWDRIIALLVDSHPRSRAGRRLSYHALTGGYVLGEIVKRTTGRDIRTFLRDEVLAPLGFTRLSYGVAPDDLPNVARHAPTGPPVLFPLSWVVRRALGVDFDEAVRLSNDPRFLTAIIPAGNVIGTPSEVARFFEVLLRGGEQDGIRVFDRRTIRRAVSEQSWLEFDLTLMAPIRYGMGFILGGDHVSLYGPGTPHAFGHLGFTNVLAWADPERDIAACLMTSGKPLATPRQYRFYDVPRTIANRVPRDARAPS